jgi:hypothetical protein
LFESNEYWNEDRLILYQNNIEGSPIVPLMGRKIPIFKQNLLDQ